ncbi:ABC transporter permease [Candidatus Aquiluna sp. UB-MaderosW2red]|jgi:osmoprotectant transport system permease protein|uniref:ABC transporter permease n=1 Tax=Candidatus Aquiluna sp. UB-MaderosW2red TaxID=1855377 RepID=UPI000B825D2A|nr:ABC transporter permease [Candidatus Aquiluna sp. UB-MaderosW2red]
MIDKFDEILELSAEHVIAVLVSLSIAAVFGVATGLLVWQRPIARSLAIATTGVILTIPSMALLALMIPTFGLGWLPTIVALSLYSLLPIVRNTVVGLREVPLAVMESAKGMGMSKTKVLFKIQLPMAWPVIITGLRVATQLAIGIAAIAAYVAGPGLGEYIFKGLSSLGAKNALNFALTGTVMIVIIALLFDALFAAISRLTTSKGIRA